MKKVLSNKTFLAFILSFTLGSIIIVPNIIGGRGIYNIWADFNVQQIPFNKIINDAIKEGSVFWTWYNELGSNFIGTFSFYNLLSPFNIIGYIFPSNWFEYLVGPLFILKYAVAGLTSYLFLKRYIKNKNYALVGSLLYSFSGFQLTNIMFYHFHDVVAFFPLLLYTLDNLIYDSKKGRFCIVVALLAFTNWFFFIGEVIFVIIYFIIKALTKEYKVTFKKFLIVALEGLLGTLIASFILLPTFLFVLSNPRVESTWTISSMFKYWDIRVYLEIFRSFIFPPEIMHIRALLTEGNYGSVETYLPFISIILVASYFFKKPKHWTSILIIIFCFFMVIPILNSSFFMFNSSYYARWFYMPVLIMSLMSILCLEEKIKLKKGIFLQLISYIIFAFGIFFYVFYTKVLDIVFDKKYLILMILVSFINLIVLYFVNKIKIEYNRILILLLCVFIFVGFWGNYMTYKYKNGTFIVDESYINYLKYNSKFDKFENSRTNSSDFCPFNMGYIKKLNNIKSFNSNINGTNFEFYNSIDYSRNVSTVIDISNKDLNDYLSVEYIISCGNEDIEQYGYVFKETIDGYNIYHNKEANEFGFSAKNYMTETEFSKLTSLEKVNVLKDTIVLNKKQIQKYKHLYDKENNVTYNSNDFKFSKNGFVANIDSTGNTLAIYTIPYDEGWSAYINGKKVNIEKVDNGMMAIEVGKGYNEIEFKYMPKGLKLGLIVSLLSFVITILYIIKNKKIDLN